MQVQAIQTRKVTAGSCTLHELLDESISELHERSVVAITSKVASLCEGRVAPLEGNDPHALARQESDLYLDHVERSRYQIHFTITRNTLIPNAGIDASNAGGVYVLWPANPQKTANEVRAYLRKKFGLKELGVIITDSTGRPLRRGFGGISLGFSGFEGVRSYMGAHDLFGREFVMETADVMGGLAAAAVLVMGEGNECTPLAVITDLPFVTFMENDPSAEDIKNLFIDPADDIFEPFLSAGDWLPGGGEATKATQK